MEVISRIMQISARDAVHKGFILDNMTGEMIESMYSITSQTNHSMAIVPANNNVVKDRKHVLAQEFADNRNEAVYGVGKKLELPTPQKIKTNIFSNTGAKIVAMPRQTGFELSMYEILKTYDREPIQAITSEMQEMQLPHYTGNVRQLEFYRKKIS